MVGCTHYAATTVQDHPNDAAGVSDGLRDAFAAVAAADLSAPEKGRWQHRLLAITNMAKRDVPRAAQQLQRWTRDWELMLSVTMNEQDR